MPSARDVLSGADAVERGADGGGGGDGQGGTMRTSLSVVLLVLASVVAVSAVSACPRLRTFSPEERQQFETQYGVNWWRSMGLIPGPETPADYADRPAGDSSITVFIPRQFWDLRACASESDAVDPRGPKSK
jgi:hypothetical protein